jgi:hypothetical protein
MSSSESSTPVIDNDHRHYNLHHHTNHPQLSLICHERNNLCKGRRRGRKRGWFGWENGMDSRDRHRRRLFISLSCATHSHLYHPGFVCSLCFVVCMDSCNGVVIYLARFVNIISLFLFWLLIFLVCEIVVTTI